VVAVEVGKGQGLSISRLLKSRGEIWAGPGLLLLATFFVWPLLRTIWVSFHKGSIIKPTREFVGINNYTDLLTNDPSFLKTELPPWSALFNSGLWVVFFTVGVIGVGLLVAVLGDDVKYEKALKAAVFLPIVISFTAASVVFRLVFAADSRIGSVNALWTTFGFDSVAWLGQAGTANTTLIVAGIWVWTSLSMTLLSSAYRSVPTELRDAARVDGATAAQTFWRVSFPVMRPTVVVVAVTMIINALKAVDLVLVMTEGGPSASSRIVGFTVFWEIFNNNRAGYGSSAAVLLLILVLPLMWYQMRNAGLDGETS